MSAILLAIILIILGLYNIKRYKKYVCVIESIENDKIIVKEVDFIENNNTINIEKDDLFNKRYEIMTNEAIIKDYDGNKIDISYLKIGDKIKIVNKKERYEIDLAYKIEPLYNIKSIQLLKN